MSTANAIALAGLAATVAVYIYHLGQTARDNEKTRQDVNRVGGLMRDNEAERKRDYYRIVAFIVEERVPGETGKLLGKLIRKDRID